MAVSPSPSVHFIVAAPADPFVLVFKNVTFLAGHMAVSLAVKLTVGDGYTVMVCVLLLTVAPLVTVRVTTCTPAVRKLDEAL
jgi:hypothetical protein